MNIRMRYFASLREVTSKQEEGLEVPEGASVADVRALLLARYPQLENALARAVCAVNHQYVTADTSIRDGDEVVFIPPVGGGARCEPGKGEQRWNR